MAEFYGYVPTSDSSIDFRQLAQGLSSSIEGVREGQKSRTATNKQARKTAEGAMEFDPVSSETVNNFTYRYADQGRNKIFEWSKQLKRGEISGREYKERIANLNDYTSSMATVAKTLDQRLQESLKRQSVGENGELPQASGIEADLQVKFGDLANVIGKDTIIDDNGRVMVVKKDTEGNIISGEDIKQVLNPLNVEFNRVDLNGMLDAGTKGWEQFQVGTTTDARKNPAYAKAKVDLINTILASPRSTASVLYDNTDEDYVVYYDEDSKQQALQQFVDRQNEINQQLGKPLDAKPKDFEQNLILMKQDEKGVYQPILTEEQLNKAKSVVDNGIEVRMGREQQIFAPHYGGGGGDSGSGDVNPSDWVPGYLASLEAFGIDKDAVKSGDYKSTGNHSFGKLDRRYSYRWDNGSVVVTKAGDPKSIIGRFSRPVDLAQFVYGTNDPSEATKMYNEARMTYLGSQNARQINPNKKTSPKKSGVANKGGKKLGE